MRDKLGRWLMAVCEEEEARPDVFCLSVAMMDLVLSRVEVSNSQLELLASACLLVSWKVREHKPISASRIVKYSQSAVTLDELLVRVLNKFTYASTGLSRLSARR